MSKPELLGEWAEDVTLTEATLKAQINPQSAATTYRLEWGLSTAPYEHSTVDIGIGSELSAHTVSLFLDNLIPGATYHFRVIASNHCHPETDPAALCVSEGTDHAFTTFVSISADTSCPNQTLRTDSSAFLPDCRAYEMVSPIDKNGGDIVRERSSTADPGPYVQATPDGEKITYTTNASFADLPSSFRFNQYLAARAGRGEVNEGWFNEGIHPPVTGQVVDGSTFGFNREFMAFSPDLCSGWFLDHQTPPPTPDGQAGYRNLYRRENCGSGTGRLEPLVPSPPSLPPDAKEDYVDPNSVQGYSDDSRHAIFVARAEIASEAAAGIAPQIYDRFNGELHLVSVNPGGIAASGEVGDGPVHSLANAVSRDASRVYWTGSAGRIFLRIHPEQGIVAGECSGPAVACTVPVSAAGASYWTAAPDGSGALYSEGENLREFDLDRYEGGEEASRLIAPHARGVAGASEDLSRIYFVSSDALPGAGANSEGDEAVAGEPNLYLDDNGVVSFVATLLAGDVAPGVTNSAYNNLSLEWYLYATRVSADGSRIAFQSRAPLTGYDNTDSVSGKPAVEVFVYEVGGGALTCVSCNPSGGRPSGVREMPEPYVPRHEASSTQVFAAASIPTWEHPLHASNVLSTDGNRLFFNANDALLPRDTNGTQDVYEWEAVGTGSCDSGDADYFADNGGCLYLISSGESSFESEFWEASADGRDVFFTTESSLLPQDPSSIDLYDARVEGGFPQPPVKKICEGEACQSPPPPPQFATPSSRSYRGPHNPPRRKCPKGKRKVRKGGKVRCVKKRANHAKHHQRRAGQTRRTGR